MALRVGLAGYGLAGRYFHAPLFKGCGFELVSVLTTNPDRIAHVRADFPDAIVVSEMSELLAHDLDLVVIASVNSAHVEQAIAALHAGVPTVVDKPLGRNLTETLEILKISGEMDDLIARRAGMREMLQLAKSQGFQPLANDACRRVLDGTTGLEEISRVVDLTSRLEG